MKHACVCQSHILTFIKVEITRCVPCIITHYCETLCAKSYLKQQIIICTILLISM